MYLHARSAVLAGLFIISAALHAQTSRGTVTGVVTDQTGAAISGAAVELKDRQTNVGRSTTTNDAGLYRFDAVDLGAHDVDVRMAGFRNSLVRNFIVEAGQVATVDVRLDVGDTSVSVEVNANNVQLQVDAPVRGANLSTKQITNLPFATRNPVSLALNLPGVSTNRYGNGIATFSVNGARGRSNNFLLDGTENNDISVAGQGFQIKNPDAIQEVSVQTSQYDAEYGRAGGGVVNVVTKSGSNAFHGTVGALLDWTYDDATTNTQALSAGVRERGRPLPGTNQWYSGTLGGPVIKDRTFFFSSYQDE
ncbi:MAG: carboxypeptidase regulatory-like domain-containing protein, partial [Bryobacteraceae bacterium]|nr:carboxypeptidase regulatory-like domain-containing protein [Bryobacteraceae bacterium]